MFSLRRRTRTFWNKEWFYLWVILIICFDLWFNVLINLHLQSLTISEKSRIVWAAMLPAPVVKVTFRSRWRSKWKRKELCAGCCVVRWWTQSRWSDAGVWNATSPWSASHSHYQRCPNSLQVTQKLWFLIMDSNQLWISGMLPGYVSGFYSYEDVHIDLRRLARFAQCRLIHAEATGLDIQVWSFGIWMNWRGLWIVVESACTVARTSAD